MAGGHADGPTWTPVRGAMWRAGVHIGRAHGYSGSLVKVGGGNAIIITLAPPLFNRITFPYFIRVGLCPTRFLPVQDAWRYERRRI